MKILMVNKFFYIKGGSETYYFALRELLESKGHEVIDFSMKDEKNFPSQYAPYFVGSVDYNSGQNPLRKLRAAANIIYSLEARKKFEKLVQKEKPDLIHLHIFQHQISPSILDIAKKYDIPTVYTAHDLKMVCLNYKMMHHGTICEECRGGKYYRCARNRCVKDSLLKSTINVAEGYLHKWKKSYDVIDRIITPSVFYKEKFRSFGVEDSRLVHIPNFLNRAVPDVKETEDSKSRYLYFGRLSEEKGILTLIKAFEQIQQKLVIVGTGPLKEQLTQYVKDNKIDNVTFKGFLSGQDLTDVVGTAKAVILPSEWYENGPYSAIEALQLGRPIIGADIGGIPELVDGNGLLFRSGDAADLKETIRRFEALSPEGYAGMEEASSSLFQKQYTKEVHYERLMQVYRAALIKKQIVEKKA